VVEILVERDFLQSSGEGTARMVGRSLNQQNGGPAYFWPPEKLELALIIGFFLIVFLT
jgi:hypothetical protein